MSADKTVGTSCLTIIGYFIGIAIGIALFALLLWWLVPVATAGAVVLGYWQTFAILAVAWVLMRTLAAGIFGVKGRK